MFRSIAIKLTLAFLLVGLTGSILVAIIIQRQTRAAFSNFIMTREQQALAINLANYYQTNGSWNGVADAVARLEINNTLQPGFRGPFPENNSLTLVGTDRTILYSNQPDEIGKKVSKSKLKGAVALQYNNETIGWLLLASPNQNFNPNSPEGNFLRNVNSATLLSATVAVLLALILGGLLAFTMTRSLRDLTEATIEIARGRFGKQVKVRSKDEIGELASSFNLMSTKLDQATRARKQMTADIAHDLRSPLSVITGYAEALSDSKLAGTPEIYNVLLQETKHLDRLVDDLRLLSLADTGELSLSLQTASPRLLLERMVLRHSVAADECHISLQVEAADDLPQVNVDVERMSQVLDNIVLNAFRYTPEGGQIKLEASVTDDKVRLSITDTGKGIAESDLPHIFDRFYRGDKSRPHDGESGLGLAIAKSIVEAHGGKIEVQSAPGAGACFTIWLNPYKPES